MGTRRRGQKLTDALLEAAWGELAERGYAAATYERIAERAGTSRPVVYRRWPTKAELALAAIRHQGARDPVDEPDTGSLRGDLLALLGDVNRRRSPIMAVLGASAGEFLRETGLSPSQVREYWLGDRATVINRVIARAVDRGEVPPERVTPRTSRLAGDLLRHEVLMRLHPASAQVIREIVDEVLLPVLTGAPPATRDRVTDAPTIADRGTPATLDPSRT